VVDQIPDAENQFFTDDGRLFVSGGENVFEIVRRADGSYDKLDTFHEACIVEGITHVGNYMYAVCTVAALPAYGDAYLLAGEITATRPTESDIDASHVHPYITLQRIGTLQKFSIPNGLEADADGNLYLNGSILFWQEAAPVQETARQIFFAPTSITIGRPPLFDDDLLLVTEKGIIFKTDINGGDRLSQLPSPF